MPFHVAFEDTIYGLTQSVTAGRFLKENAGKNESFAAVKINGVPAPLSAVLNRSCRLETVAPASPEAAAVFRRTLNFLTMAVSAELFPENPFEIRRSVTFGYAYSVGGSGWNEDKAERICRMLNAVRTSGETIREHLLSYAEVKDLYAKGAVPESTFKLLRFIPSDEIRLYERNGIYRYSFHFLTTDMSLLPPCETVFEENGCVVRFTADPETGKPSPFRMNRTLVRVYEKGSRWGEISGVKTVGDLNECIRENRVADFIRINETLQENALAEAASRMAARGDEVRAVLLAGPSSSGKTTTLKRLCTQLEVLGYHPIPLSLDNYYRNREEIPRDENGDYDFECLESIDVPLIRRQLSDFFDGKTVTPPVFDFVSGKSREGRPIEPRPDSIIVIEGIHGLNPELLPKTAADRVFRVYLSALTQIRIDSGNRIATTDNRLLRRLVRDAKYRNTPAERTFEMWPKVINGERKYIFPFQNEADIAFNSSLDYEISVLKVYAEPLLRSIRPDSPHFAAASHLLKLLSLFLSIPEQDVPPYSLLREFIGNSGFSY